MQRRKDLLGKGQDLFTLLFMVCFLKCRKDCASQETNPRYCCKVQPGNPQGNPRFCNKANYAQAKQFHFLTKLLALVVASPCLLSGTLDIGNTLTSKWPVPRPLELNIFVSSCNTTCAINSTACKVLSSSKHANHKI